jgi:uncharacterized membrane protein HdeD (DUF308 family)
VLVNPTNPTIDEPLVRDLEAKRPASASQFAAVLLLGWLLIISGVVQGISLFDARNVPHFWLQLVSVVLSVLVGVLLIRHGGEGLSLPVTAIWLLGVLLGIQLICEGAALGYLAWKVRAS